MLHKIAQKIERNAHVFIRFKRMSVLEKLFLEICQIIKGNKDTISNTTNTTIYFANSESKNIQSPN